MELAENQPLPARLLSRKHAVLPFSFAREDDGSPRQDILLKQCPADLATFRECMAANGNDENKCMEPKTLLDKCAGAAFRTVNMAGAGNWLY